MKKIGFRFMAGALVVSIAGLGMVSITRALSTGSILTSQALGRVEYNGALAASRLNGWIENQIGYLEAVSENLRWAAESNDSEAPRRIIESHYQNYEHQFFRLYFGYPDGSGWFSNGWQPEKDWYACQRPWYTGAEKNRGKIFISEPYRTTADGNIYIAVSKAVIRNGELIAVTGVDIDLNTIQGIMNEIPIAEGRGFTFLVAEDTGIVLVHPDKKRMPSGEGEFLTLYDIPEKAYQDLLKTGDGESVPITRPDGTRLYYNGHTIPSAGWKLFSSVDRDTIRDPITRHIRFEIFLSLLVFLLVCVLLFTTSRAMGRAARTAREHSNMKTAFLANMSHEIRTPMNGIIGFAELALENSDVTDKNRGYLEKIRNSAKDLLSIINNILDISKIEAGKVSLEKTPFRLHDVFTACENAISLKAAEKRINLYVYSEPVIAYKLLGDPTRLRQVLLNLLSNAVKFTNAGTVKLMAAVEKTTPGRVVLRFEVKDSGIGMTAAQTARIFRSFEQGDSSTTRKYGGTGLGLAITKNLVELMGGKLSVDSAPGIGSRFSFVLDFELSDQPDQKAENPEKEPLAAAARRILLSGRVLICEDNPMNQELVRDHLERFGIEADIRENGKEGVEAVKESLGENRPYDLILMDVHMPVMDGLEASTEIKRLGCPTPIVALTANVLTRDTDIYHHYGIGDHLGKPFTARELQDCLLKYLKPVSASSPEPGGIIDYREGLNMTGGNRSLSEKLRRDFYAQNRDFFEKFSALLGELQTEGPESTGSILKAHRMVHTLKSSAAIIGAKKLRAAAGEMEAALADGKAAYSREQLETLRETLEASLAALETENGGDPGNGSLRP
jgi:signal transduction histidine kinase/CheY-like chemotaxis protein/HPt (histidine-containing phosphotransfer) domain-containing protein